jgi:F0F1-type ATP synthase membrane subunit a
MIKKINKNNLFAFLLLANGMIYANPTDNDPVEGDDPATTVDINHFITLLFLVSIFYAFYSIRKKKLTNN